MVPDAKEYILEAIDDPEATYDPEIWDSPGFTLVLFWLAQKWHQRCHRLAHRRMNNPELYLTKEQQKACLDSAAVELIREITQQPSLNYNKVCVGRRTEGRSSWPIAMNVASDLMRPFPAEPMCCGRYLSTSPRPMTRRFLSRSNCRRMRRSPCPLLRGQNSTARTMAQTMPQPIQVMVG
jgi:hypothetical protein